MKDSLSFYIPCIPPKSTAQTSLRIMKRKDGSQFVGKMQSSKGKQTQSELLTLLMPHAPQIPFEGAVAIQITWNYPWRKSESKKNRAKKFVFCDTRPDVDNLCKMLFDCMTRLGFWADDSQIAVLSFSKTWGDEPGISIAIREIEQ